MTDIEALHAAVLADPDDDTARLALADALDERGGPGDAARAEFVRVQVAGDLASVPLMCLVPLESFLGCQPHQTRRVARPGWAAAWVPDGKTVVFRRGFVEEVACPSADWLAHGDDLVKMHPVRRVWLTAACPAVGWEWTGWQLRSRPDGTAESDRWPGVVLSINIPVLSVGTGGRGVHNPGPSVPVSSWRLTPRG